MKFTEKLQLESEVYGKIWGEKPFSYHEFKELIQRRDERFFPLLQSEVQRINKVFLNISTCAIREYKARKNWKIRPSNVTRIINGWRGVIHGSVSHSSYSVSHACQEYSNVNVLALRKILTKYDKYSKSKSGAEFWNSLWKDHSGGASLSHSPNLVRMKAIESIEALSLDHVSTSEPALPTTEAQCRLSGTDLMCPICLEHLYQPIALSCGHIFCFTCLLTGCHLQNCIGTPQALISHIHSDIACFECRQTEVFRKSKIIPELHTYIRLKYPDVWNERDLIEKKALLEKRKKLRKRKNQAKVFGNGRFHPSDLLSPQFVTP